MLTAGNICTTRMTGNVRLPRCETGWNRVAGDHQGGRGGDHAAAEAVATAFRLPVGPESGYPAVNRERMGRPYGKCRFIELDRDNRRFAINEYQEGEKTQRWA